MNKFILPCENINFIFVLNAEVKVSSNIKMHEKSSMQNIQEKNCSM